MDTVKLKVKEYWDKVPCGTGNIAELEGTLSYYEAISENRYWVEPFIPEFAEFDKWKDKNVLEVGCGTGSDLIEFARKGAIVTGIDLSTKSIELAKRRLEIYQYVGGVFEADAESLPFEDNTFDMVYSLGVLHHTPDTEKAISEIYRVLKPGGNVKVMLYHKYSLVSLQVKILYGLLKNIDRLMAEHMESVGTKVYTVGEVRHMFSMFDNLKIKTRVSKHDIRYQRHKYLPDIFLKVVPDRIGWHITIDGTKGV